MMPLSRQEEFFVPEFSDELESNATTEVSSHADFAGADADDRDTSSRRSVNQEQAVEHEEAEQVIF